MRFENLEELRKLNRLPAKLVFDTASQPRAAGVRRQGTPSRHLLYEIDDLCLDLRFEPDSQTASSLLLGQLADRRDPLKPLTDLPVILVSNEELIAETISNRMGEFQLQYGAEKPSAVCLVIGNDQLIEVPME